MDETTIGVLTASQEFVTRQQEMLPLLAAAVGVEESRVFYAWCLHRAWPQRGKLADADWEYFFHGYDCDLKNLKDGRRLGIYFTPKGCIGTVGSWEILRFIMTAVVPWRVFPELQKYFANGNPPYTEQSGDWQKLLPIWNRLDSEGFFEPADQKLVELRAKYTSKGPDGLTYVSFPPEISEETRVDTAVAHRPQLSQKALQFLKTQAANHTPSADFLLGKSPNEQHRVAVSLPPSP